MAGKTKKKKKKAPARYRAAAGANGKATRTAKARKPGPRSQTLPGMAKVRDGKLDNLCEALAEVRGTINNAKQEEAGLMASTLQRMVARDVTVYKHGGVELARVPGAEKVRVRLSKDDGDAGAEDLEVAGENDQVGDERRDAVEGVDEDVPASERGIGSEIH